MTLSAASASSRTSSAQLYAGMLLGFLVIVVPTLAALWLKFMVGESPAATGLPVTTDTVQWALPAARALRDLALAITVGASILAATCAPPGARTVPSRSLRALTDLASITGALWVASGVWTLVLTYVDVAGETGANLPEVVNFVKTFDLGGELAANAALGLLATTLLVVSSAAWARGIAAVLCVTSLWPLAGTGHAAAALSHDLVVDAQFAHLVGISIWFGGLVALVCTSRFVLAGDDGPAELRDLAWRFSFLAGAGFVAVAVSGVVAATLRLEQWSDLGSTYGFLLVVKGTCLVLLGAAGLVHRRRLLPGLGSGVGVRRRQAFLRLATSEIAVMAVAVAAGVALGRIPPPSSQAPTSNPTQALLGHDLPPPLSAATWFTQWRVDALWLVAASTAIVVYVRWVRRLRRRGDKWSIGRTMSWVFGWLVVIWSTSGPPGVYGDVLFSMHMVQHMTVAMAVPVFLVLGAPITLALRGLPRRLDGSRGAREWLLATVQSRIAGFIGNSVVAAAAVVISLVAFYYTGLFEYSLRSHTGHTLMLAHFLLVGYLFASGMVGIDPGPKRLSYPMRVLVLSITYAVHSLVAVSLMSANTVLAGAWFNAFKRPWGAEPLSDQHLGASLGWLLGDYPLAIVAGALIWSWVHADRREAKRYERRADRDGDRERTAYNDALSRLNGHRPQNPEP